MAELQKAKKAVQATMKLPGAKLLFNQPVDPEALGLPDYFKVVKTPMDLGTIQQRLSAGSFYSIASQVKADIDLVWSNCILYNSRPADQPTRDLCADVQRYFEKLWTDAGLLEETTPPKASPSPKAPPVTVNEVTELKVPDQYNILPGTGEMPIRLLSDFSLHSHRNPQKLVPLKGKSKETTILKGTLLTPDEGVQKGKRRQAHVVLTGPIVEWCFQYGSTPGIWVITEHAWYKLVAPAEEYAEIHLPAAHRLALCGTAVREVQQDPDLDVSEAVERAFASQGDPERPEVKLRQFVDLQLRSWIKDRLDDEEEAAELPSERAGARQSKRRLQVEQGEEDAGEDARPKRRKLSQGAVRRQADAPLEDPEDVEQGKGEENDEEWDLAPGMTARQRTKEAQARKAKLAAESQPPKPPVKKENRAKRERESNVARGPPPEPYRSKRTPPHLLPDLIMVWELLHVLGGILQIAPIPLWRLEAAIFPGPHPALDQPQQRTVEKASLEQPGDPQQEAAKNSLPTEAVAHPEADSLAAEVPTGTLESKEQPANGTSEVDLAQEKELEDAAGSLVAMETGEGNEKAAVTPEAPEADGEAAEAGTASVLENADPIEHANGMVEGSKDPEAERVILRRKKKKRRGGRPPRPKPDPTAEALPPAKTGIKVHIKSGGAVFSHKRPSSSPSGTPSIAVDRDAISSALVLREVHCALLRPIQGLPLTPEAAPPAMALLILPPEANASQAQWAERTSAAVLSSPEPVEPFVWESALQLAYGEYSQLSPERRVALLRWLAHLALGTEPVREVIQSLAETTLPPRGKQAQVTDGDGQPALPPPEPVPGSLEEWDAWKETVRLTMRKPLGTDFRKRRFWILGGQSAAWRVFVEDAEGADWGWYEGKQLCNLIEWLKAGGIDREASLLRALSRLPLPKQYVPQQLRRPVAGQPLDLPDAASTLRAGDEGAAEAVVSLAELSSRRPDGVRGKVAPLLRGESNWPDAAQNLPFGRRILACVDALLADIAFWFEGDAAIRKRSALLHSVRMAATPAGMGPALLEVEKELFEGGRMDEEWGSLWRSDWRAEVVKCSHLQDCLLYTAALQEHAIRNKESLGRTAFSRIARDSNCQLQCPFPGDSVVVLKTGVLQHLRRYMQSLGLEALPSAEVAEAPASPRQQPPILVPERSAEPLPERPSPSAELPSQSQHDEAEDGTSLQSELKNVAEPAAAARTEEGKTLEKSPSRGPSQQSNPILESTTASVRHGGEPQEDEPQDGESEPKAVTEATPPEASLERHDALPTPAEQLPPELADQLRQQWHDLKAKAENLQQVQRFSVVTVAYRRNLLDGSAAKSLVEQADAEDERISDAARWPVAWLILRPLPNWSGTETAGDAIALPLRIELSLPDFVTNAQAYDASMRRAWAPGQRFRMFFAGKTHARARAAGVYYKGTVTSVRLPLPTGSSDVYDPWESVQVEWDASRSRAAGECESVSPWEIERDPDDAAQIEEDKKVEEAQLRASQRELVPNIRLEGSEVYKPEAYSRDWQRTDRKRARPEADSEWQPEDSPQASEGGEDWRPSRADRAAARNRAALEAANLSTSVPQEVLDVLQPLSKDRFVMLVGNWYRLNRGKFKVPIFAHQELDLHRVFWEVQARGGSDTVTAEKMWKEVCRSLGVDLTGQTSASYNMRLNYERCLLEFEHYLATGQYSSELASGQAPSADVVQQPPSSKLAAREGSNPPGVDSASMSTRRTRQTDRQAAAAEAFKGAEAQETGLSYTQLLGLGDEGLLAGAPLMPPPPLFGSAPAAAPSGPPLADLRSLPWQRLVAPVGVTAQPSKAGQGWVATVHGVPPVVRASQPPAIGGSHPSSSHQMADLMPTLLGALQAGLTPLQLHGLVDQAAASLGLPPAGTYVPPLADHHAQLHVTPDPESRLVTASEATPLTAEEPALQVVSVGGAEPGSAPEQPASGALELDDVPVRGASVAAATEAGSLQAEQGSDQPSPAPLAGQEPEKAGLAAQVGAESHENGRGSSAEAKEPWTRSDQFGECVLRDSPGVTGDVEAQVEPGVAGLEEAAVSALGEQREESSRFRSGSPEARGAQSSDFSGPGLKQGAVRSIPESENGGVVGELAHREGSAAPRKLKIKFSGSEGPHH